MTSFVIAFSSFGMVFIYCLGLWLYGQKVKNDQLEELAMKFAEDQQKFNLYFYNIAIKVMKQKVAQQEAEKNNVR
jgi:hypothetical protein